MKKFVHISLALLLAALLSVPLTVCGLGPDETAPDTTEYDGYLVALPEGAAPGAGPLEYVAPDVYRTEDARFAGMLLESGCAERVEPEYAVSLFSLADEADWSYTAVSGQDAEALGLSGSGVRIAVIDSGVDADNPNLGGTLFGEGWDYLEKTSEMQDTVGHGTQVCQIIAGSGALGVRGAARGAELIPLRCFSATKGSVSDIIAAIYDAVDRFHCGVINMSWGMENSSGLLEKALRHAYDAGAILVAAAGNVDRSAAQGTVFYPAACPEVIGVGAVDSARTVSRYSQQTEAVFVCAPGDRIITASLSGTLAAQSGTSFAAPYVTAELALLRELVSDLTAEEALSLLRERSSDLGTAGYDTTYGYGFADVTGLLGQSWCAVREEAAARRFTGWLRCEGGGRVISASYADSGRMLDYALHAFDTPICAFNFAFDPDAAAVRLFFTDSGFASLSEPVRFDTPD